MYHSTNEDIDPNNIDFNKLGKSGWLVAGKGLYTSTNLKRSAGYGKNTYEYDLKIDNPASLIDLDKLSDDTKNKQKELTNLYNKAIKEQNINKKNKMLLEHYKGNEILAEQKYKEFTKMGHDVFINGSEIVVYDLSKLKYNKKVR